MAKFIINPDLENPVTFTGKYENGVIKTKEEVFCFENDLIYRNKDTCFEEVYKVLDIYEVDLGDDDDVEEDAPLNIEVYIDVQRIK